jgi:threonine/homoserine/homoserine lactone efflux protein
MNMYLRGLVIGISIAAPVGPIGVLCIQRTLTEGRLSGLVSGLGAATADAIYGVIAGFGLTFISSFLVAQQSWLRLIGGAFLCYLGIRTLLSKPAEVDVQIQSKGLMGNYFSIFILTLTNPLTILSFAAIFAGLGLVQGDGDYTSAILMVLGVFTGSALWWLILSQSVGLFRMRVTPQWMGWINRFSGCLILIFGILALISLGLPNSPL